MPKTLETTSIHDLNLYEDLFTNNAIHILRVPGGFIYTLYFPGRSCDTTSIFVPLLDTFNDPKVHNLT